MGSFKTSKYFNSIFCFQSEGKNVSLSMKPTLLDATLFVLLSHLLRYFLIAGLYYFIVYIVLRKRSSDYLIQNRWPDAKSIRREIFWSVSTMFVFAGVAALVILARRAGIVSVYTDIHQYGWPYLIFSVLLLILWHDFYFYITHRAMHHKKIYPHVHLTHHLSTNPSPWAAFSFHPFEAVVEALVVPIALFFLPLHPLAILFFLLYMTVLNCLGHLAVELFPEGFTRGKLTFWHNTATHRNMHHRYVNCNYSLYFNWWDRVFKTNHPNYHEAFDEAAKKKIAATENVPSMNA